MGGGSEDVCVLSPVGSMESSLPGEGGPASDVSMLSRSASTNSRDSCGDLYCPSPLANRLQPSLPEENASELGSVVPSGGAPSGVEPGSPPAVDAGEALPPGNEPPASPTGSAGSGPKASPPSPSKEVVFDLDDAAFSSDYFRMYEFKVPAPAAPPQVATGFASASGMLVGGGCATAVLQAYLS